MRLAESALRAGYRLNSFETLGSTNDEAMARAGAGDRGRLWIVAASQGAGRGRQGRVWASPPGNLYASLLLVDAVEPVLAWQLGFVAGVALAEAVGTLLGEPGRIAIKWPNDLLAGEAKLAGILCEASRTDAGSFATVLGFGVNCASHPGGTPYPATDLATLADGRPMLDELFAALSATVPDALALWNRGSGFAAIRAAWLARSLPPGTAMSVGARGERRTGTFHSIDAGGRLVLATPGGLLSIEVGDILLNQGAGQSRLMRGPE